MKKTQHIHIKVTEEEKEKLKKLAKIQGFRTLSSYILQKTIYLK